VDWNGEDAYSLIDLPYASYDQLPALNLIVARKESTNPNLPDTNVNHADKGTLSYALDTSPLGGGWQESSWFGLFHQASSEWVYHFDFGWIYAKPENDSSIWFWSPSLGWLWTNKDAYPHVWRQDEYEWSYFSRLADNTFTFYNYSTSSWGNVFPTYELTINSFPPNGGSTSGGGAYKEGTVTKIHATAAEGYVFKRWFGDVKGTESTLSVSASGDLLIYAQFSKLP
jgi:hypothetical protein